MRCANRSPRGVSAVRPRPEDRARRATSEARSRKSVRIYPYGVSKDRLTRAINDLQVPATIARTPKDADIVLTLKAQEKRQPRTLKDLEEHGLEISVIRSKPSAR